MIKIIINNDNKVDNGNNDVDYRRQTMIKLELYQ